MVAGGFRQHHRATERGKGRGRMMGKKKEKPWVPAGFGVVIEEGLPQCSAEEFNIFCSLVWQLQRMEMTLNISQAHIGDI